MPRKMTGMYHYTGWYFCTLCNWNDEIFHAKNLVSIEPGSGDYNTLLNKISLFPDDELNSWRTYAELKPEVFKWLEENVRPFKKEKGWCCGNKEYNSEKLEGFSLFFHRIKDALNFIKTWSVHKIATGAYNQDTYVRKILCETTGKLKIVKNIQ